MDIGNAPATPRMDKLLFPARLYFLISTLGRTLSGQNVCTQEVGWKISPNCPKPVYTHRTSFTLQLEGK